MRGGRREKRGGGSGKGRGEERKNGREGKIGKFCAHQMHAARREEGVRWP